MLNRLSVLAFMIILLPISAWADEPSDARKKELAYFLTQDCGSCHGLKMNGGLGKPLTVDALSLFTDDDLITTILDGRPGTAMPPWRGVINEADARFIVGLLRKGKKQ